MTNKIKRAIYPGSFDPITYGHIDIAMRSLNIFDELIIAIGDNRNKKPLFSSQDRIAQIGEVFDDNPAIKVISFNGLLVNLARDLKCFTIIRGLRAVSDFEFEFQLSSINKKMEPRIELFFMMTSEKYFYVSSSIVKEIASNSGDISDFVPNNILADMKKQKRIL